LVQLDAFFFDMVYRVKFNDEAALVCIIYTMTKCLYYTLRA
jgi:hypothetical protein